jgi:alpha-methylacyl-CoA racemase
MKTFLITGVSSGLGRAFAVGALEAAFYAEFLTRLGLPDDPARQHDRSEWPALRGRIAEAFLHRTRAEWTEVFAGSDACVAPVVGLREAIFHPHLAARGTFVERDGRSQPAPAPRFSTTPTSVGGPPPRPGAHTREVFAEWGVASTDALATRRL